MHEDFFFPELQLIIHWKDLLLNCPVLWGQPDTTPDGKLLGLDRMALEDFSPDEGCNVGILLFGFFFPL